MYRRLLVLSTVIAVLMVLPATALAEGTASIGQQSVHTAVNGQLEVESERGWCVTASPCYYDTGPTDTYWAGAHAYINNDSSGGRPDEIYGECDHYWTDSAGVRHDDYMYVDAYDSGVNDSSLVYVMNSGAESNTHAMAMIMASGTGQNGSTLTISGFGVFDNSNDLTAHDTGFLVTIQGTVYHETYNGEGWYLDSTSPGQMTCSTMATTWSLDGRYATYTFYHYGEAETSD